MDPQGDTHLDNSGPAVWEYIRKAWTLNRMANGKAPGPTQKQAEMIKWLDDDNLNLIKLLFNRILQEGITPSMWRVSNIYGINKNGDPNHPLNYQPIALLPVLYKLLTKIIIDWMTEVVKWEGLLSIAQNGFRQDQSTVGHILSLRGIMEEAVISAQQGAPSCICGPGGGVRKCLNKGSL